MSSRSAAEWPSVPDVGATIEPQRRRDPMIGTAEYQTSVAAVAFVLHVQQKAIRPSTSLRRLASCCGEQPAGCRLVVLEKLPHRTQTASAVALPKAQRTRKLNLSVEITLAGMVAVFGNFAKGHKGSFVRSPLQKSSPNRGLKVRSLQAFPKT